MKEKEEEWCSSLRLVAVEGGDKNQFREEKFHFKLHLLFVPGITIHYQREVRDELKQKQWKNAADWLTLQLMLS